ncbi:clarin [Holotrichia oblita]|uniref:Clarin n=1 Tax=Holotrichia oblita TaxID=644536 RepID=A0ACB9T120_HOLOL|nr:clarin [Holotrichia oblita]
MVKTLPQLVFATFITSGLALVISIVAFGTDQWVRAGVNIRANVDNRVNYGLFIGSYTRRTLGESEYQLTITCDFGENKCAMLCGITEVRNFYLQLLFAGGSGDGYAECSQRSSRTLTSTQPQTRADEDTMPDGFINSGVWLTTVLFLGISCMFGLVSTVLAIWNTVANPVETFLSITGLFIYNSIACGFSLTAMLLWGIHFAIVLTDSAGIYDTISLTGTSEGQASLGYSYWLVLVGLLGYIASVVILAVRQYLINKEPDTIVNIEDKNDNTIILF